MPDTQILIVDDEPVLANTIQRWLESLNYSRTLVVTSGARAIQVALALKPDLILMDVKLGDGIDGVVAAEQILTHLDIPIIYMTAYLEEEILQRAKNTEPFGYLLKPFEGQDLQVAIEVALYKHQMQQKLKESRQWLAATLRSIGDGVITTDTGGRITFMNPVAESLIGWKQSEVLGKPLQAICRIITEGTVELMDHPPLNETREPQRVPRDSLLLTRAGAKIPVDHSHAPIVDDYGHVTGTVLVLRDTTERKQYEEALRLSEERYRLAQRVAYLGSWEWDIQTEMFYWSDQVEAMLGFTPGQFKGTYEAFLQSVHPEDRELLREAVNTSLKENKEYEVEHRVIWPDGTVRWILGRGRLLKDEHENPVRFVGAIQDISKRKQAEETFQRRNDELALLNKVSQAFISSLNLDQVLTSVLNEVRNLLGVVACSVWLIDPETEELVCRQVTDPQDQIVRGWRLAPGQGIAGWVAQQGQSQLVSDAQIDSRHYKKIDQKTGLEIHSILTVPLRAGQAVIGVLQVVDKAINRFTKTDLALLESLAATAAIAIENARLYEQTRRDAETKAILLREVNHRVKNNLAAIIGLLYAEQQYPRLKNQTAYQDFIRDLINRIHGLATVHHLLSEAQWLPLPLFSLVEQIVSSALQALPLDKYITLTVSPSPIHISPKQASDLALVINELATNSMKYALAGRQNAHISVTIETQEELVQLEFRDDGPGYPESVLGAERSSVGVYLIQTLVTKGLDGEVTFLNDNGAVTKVRFRITA